MSLRSLQRPQLLHQCMVIATKTMGPHVHLGFNPLSAKYNIMSLVSDNEIKMAAHRRNSAYYVFVLYDYFLRTNDEDVECSL